MAIGFIFRGISIITVFEGLYKQQGRWLQLLKYGSLLICGSIGVTYLGDYLLASHFNVFDMFSTPFPGIPVPITAALCTVLTTWALLVVDFKNKSQSAVVFLANVPAMFVFQLTIYALAGVILHIPVLFSFKMALSGIICFLLGSLAILIGTIPFQGLYKPFLSRNIRGRWYAVAAIVLDFLILSLCIVGISNIQLLMNGQGDAQKLYLGFEYLAATLSMLVTIVILRAVHYFNNAIAQEQNFIKSEERFRLVVDATNDGIWDLNILTGEAYWNERLFEMLGLDQHTFKPTFDSFLALIHPDDQARVVAIAQQHLADPSVKYEAEYRLLHSKGHYIYTLARGEAQRDREGKPFRFVGSNTDITQIKQAEEETRQYAARLEHSNKELEQFSTIASHDLQEPLRKVKVFSEMLVGLSPENSRDIADRMQAAIERMQILIDDLLLLSRINRKGKPFTQIDLNAILKAVMEDLEISIREAGAQILTDDLGMAYGDESQVRQLFQNLISNALKYRQDDVSPVLRITCLKDKDGFCRVTIEDNGLGIKQEHLERIFKPLQRLHGVGKYPGTGMGLAICKKIVERHKGIITVESEYKKGSRFSVTLPDNSRVSSALLADTPVSC